MIYELCEELATFLSGLPALGGATVSSAMLVEISSQEMETLHVVVQPIIWTATSASRASGMTELKVGVYVSKTVNNNADSAAVLDAVEGIATALLNKKGQSGDYSYVCNEVTATPNADDSLNQGNYFKATVEATFKMVGV